ncbi:MAG: PAS domain S-box protein [Candidatus Omnitrophica bacterium]|nr:PAS domain S-box protein [Candidatus Omnitrophota bacterium]
MQGVENVFKRADFDIEQYVRYMDMKRFSYSKEYFAKLKESYRADFKNIHLDAILAADNDALDFLRTYRDELFPGVPVIFCGINDYTAAMLDGRSDISGVVEDTEYIDTIKLALSLRPYAKNVFVVVDNSTTGRAHRSAVEKIQSTFSPEIHFEYLSLGDYTLEEMGQKLSELKNDSVVLMLQQFLDKNNVFYSIKKSTSFLTQKSAVPCFVVTESRMGFGPLGGKVISGFHQGVASAEMVLKLMQGEDVSEIPVMIHGSNKYMFDYNAMKRYNVLSSQLPPGSIIISQPVSVWERFKIQIITAALIFILMFINLIVMALEILRRKRLEKVLIKRENEQHQFIAKSPISIAIMTSAGKVEFVNDCCVKTFGYTIEDISTVDEWYLRAYPDERYRQEVMTKWKSFVEVALKEGRDIPRHEYRVTGKDGVMREVKIFGAKIGEKFLIFLEDVSLRKQTEDQLRKTLDELRKSNKDLEQFAYVASHDLQEPIRTVSAYAQLLKDAYQGRPQDVINKYISFISDGARRSHQMITDLLTLSRVGLGTETFGFFDFSIVLERVKDELKGVIQGKEVQITADTLPVVYGDLAQLTQVLQNLIDNGIKFNKQKPPVMHISAKGNSVEWVFAVTDNGIGIAPEYFSKIFDLFQKIHTAKEYPGSGVGLTIVKKIIEHHNGRVWIESVFGQGSTFFFTLPRNRDNNTALI